MNKMNWACPKKIGARLATIVSRYRKQFGYCLSPREQYWSMAGLCDKPGCEIDQVVSAGLVNAEQFHGVEILKDIYDVNSEVFPEANWHHGDFYNVMAGYDEFRPAIVNADLIQTAERGASYVAKIMALLAQHSNVMLIANFVLRNRWYELKTGEYVLGKLYDCQPFRYAMRNGFKHDGRCYRYRGTGKRSNTVMGSFIFTKGD